MDLSAFVPGNSTGQVTKSPKLHFIDSGLVAMLAGRDSIESLARNPQFAGGLVETMVSNDLRVQSNYHDFLPRLFHFREDSHEVDLVVEGPDGKIMGMDIKLAADPGPKSLSGLRRLRESAGNRWAGGLLLCRVPAGRTTEDDLVVAPLEAVWQVIG